MASSGLAPTAPCPACAGMPELDSALPEPISSATGKEEHAEIHSCTGRTWAVVGSPLERARLQGKKQNHGPPGQSRSRIRLLGWLQFPSPESSALSATGSRPSGLEHWKGEMSCLGYSISYVCEYQLPGYQRSYVKNPQKRQQSEKAVPKILQIHVSWTKYQEMEDLSYLLKSSFKHSQKVAAPWFIWFYRVEAFVQLWGWVSDPLGCGLGVKFHWRSTSIGWAACCLPLLPALKAINSQAILDPSDHGFTNMNRIKIA